LRGEIRRIGIQHDNVRIHSSGDAASPVLLLPTRSRCRGERCKDLHRLQARPCQQLVLASRIVIGHVAYVAAEQHLPIHRREFSELRNAFVHDPFGYRGRDLLLRQLCTPTT